MKYVCVGLLIASHFYADWVKQCADGAGYSGGGAGGGGGGNCAN